MHHAHPAGLRAHFTRGITSSMMLLRGISVEDICLAASWTSTSTFVRSYLRDMTANSVSHSVLGARSEATSSAE